MIKYRDEYYFVIEDSKSYRDYVTILKYEPLTKDEINQYNSSLNTTDNGEVAYSNTEIFKLLDNWKNDFSDDLVIVDGYKTRLLTADELQNNFNFVINANRFEAFTTTPNWLSKQYSYWTMSPRNDSEYQVIAVGAYLSKSDIYSYAVRPVINVDKCAVEGGCEVEEITIEDGCIEDKSILKGNTIINSPIVSVFVGVGNTLNNISFSILVVCGILIIGGVSFFIYSFIRSKKELNKLK